LTDTAPALSAALDHEFADPRLLSQALTHRSYVNEHPDASDNDGLAFVGDAVLAWSWPSICWTNGAGDSVGLSRHVALRSYRARAWRAGRSASDWRAPAHRQGRAVPGGEQGVAARHGVEAVLGVVYLRAVFALSARDRSARGMVNLVCSGSDLAVAGRDRENVTVSLRRDG